MMSPAVRAWLTRLYPRPWRDRYAVEFDAMLEQCLHSPLDVVDVILGALDAHLQLMSGENVNWRLMNMLNKLRTTILIVFASYIGFVIAGMALVGLLDDSPMIPLMKIDLASALAMSIIRVGAMVAFLAVVVGGVPLAITVIRRALTADRSNMRLLLIPIIAFGILVFYFGFIFLVSIGQIQIAGIVRQVQPGNFPPGNRIMMAGLMLIFILGAIASTIAVWKAISRTHAEQATFHAAGRTVNIDLYKFAYIPAVITSISMLLISIATIVWSRLVFSALPQVFAGDFGPFQTSTQAWDIGIIMLMFISSIAALLAVVRGRLVLTHT
jgi:hypothetical protein